jgi:glycosyltransferase involved in cell wall biosynthesis
VPENSLVVPVYGNSAGIGALVDAVGEIAAATDGGLEAVFVVDGSRDDSAQRLAALLPSVTFPALLIEHARNFGSFAAIRTGMEAARGRRIAVMAADLQEPPELVREFLRVLAADEADIVVGERMSRDDGRGDAASKLYWRLYRRFVSPEMPAGGVDVFACTAQVRDVVCRLERTNTSLVAQLFWVGFRRRIVPYARRPRPGRSGWTLRRRLRYLSDSVFAFTDLPVRLLWLIGLLGLALATVLAVLVIVARAVHAITVPGYAPTVLIVVFFGSMNCMGLGVIGSYMWRSYELTKQRPGAIVRTERRFEPRGESDD